MVTLTTKLAMWPEPHDFIHLEIRNFDEVRTKVAEFYKSGLSMREIEKRVDVSKTKIRDLLLQAGIPRRPLRNELGRQAPEKQCK